MIVTPDIALLFVSASLALALAPGPDNIFVLMQSALYGRRAGFAVIFGLLTGILVHTTFVALGIAVIFQTSAVAFTALKLAGAGYLLYLAWQAFRANASELTTNAPPQQSAKKLYLRGVLMNITNPKVAIFFLAFLPQFADPARGSMVLQIMLFGLLFSLTALLVFSFVTLAAGHLGALLRNSPRAQIILNRIAGVVFVGLAARLLVSER